VDKNLVNRIISILEDKGLVSDELVQRFVFGNPSKVVFEVRDALSEALDEEFYRIYDAGEANPSIANVDASPTTSISMRREMLVMGSI